MSDNQLNILINARDMASGVMRSVGGSIDTLNRKAGAIAKDGFNKFANASKNMATGLMIGIPVIAGLLGGMAFKAGQAQAQVQTMGVALETAMGGNMELVEEAQKNIIDFATKTPFALGEVQTAFIKLKNMGLNPSNEALTAYGDTASAMGKSLNDMVEAVADAATGEFERLKEFGIRASSQGNRVSLTFKGVTTTIAKESGAIEDYLIGLGQTNFAGGMEKQSKTMAGLFSTLSDTINLKLASAFDTLGGTSLVTGIFEQLIITIDSINIDLWIERFSTFFNLLKTGDGLERFFNEAQIKMIRSTVEAVKAVWAEIDKAVLAESVLAGLAGVIMAIVVPALAIMATNVVLATWPFVALGLTIAALYYAWQTDFGGMRTRLQEFWAVVRPILENLWRQFNDNLRPQIEQFARNVWPLIKQAFDNTRPIMELIADIVGDHLVRSFDAWATGIGFVINKLGELLGWINNNFDKVTNFANKVSELSNSATSSISSFRDRFPRFATGTNYAPAGLALVGERGPEIVNLPRGARVTPNNQMSNMSAGGGGINIGEISIGSYMGTERDKRNMAEDLADAIELILKQRKLI